ncbi:unnamed protein product [Fraxinus pennsylvanica]|uniref:Enoyl reductase (ER) domain-containing protein n=1 Tax=Fraxinus pennsylvanica TaxID=56036 RepID=A0AAD2A3P5_9LAMI|nr:unnamed protein product [Fraxinus pennsylvanica]
MEVMNRFIAIKASIDGFPQESDFEIKTETLSLSIGVGTNQVLVKNLYVSIDPYQLNRMKSHSSSQSAIYFSAAIIPGEAIDTYGVGRVVESEKPDFEKGDLVVGLLSWGEYTIVKEGALLNKLDPMGFPLPHHVGTLGFSGLSAYGGFFEVCKPKKGETVFVSAASGSVGCLVGQYAKLFGCYVVGCAGTRKKVDLLKQELGFDDAFNYKEETDLKSALKRYFPDGIDIYFDNVGGEMLEAAVDNMNTYGRVAVCGIISEYTNDDFFSTTVEHLRTGKMKALADISHGLENVPSAFIGLFRGDNIGKKIVQIAEE